MRPWRVVEELPDGRRRITVRDPREHEKELLWPARYPEVETVKLESALLQFASAQLQQNPVDAAGGTFKREWIKFWSPDGKIPGTMPLPRRGLELQSWDCAFKGKDSSDPSVGGIWRRAAGRFFLLDCEWDRWDFPGLLEAVRRLSDRWPRVFHKIVEDKANGPAIISSLKDEYPGFEEVDPEGGKEARANAIAPLFKLGLVYLPHPSLFPWVEAAIMELIRFPKGAHDDFVDMTSQGLLKLNIGGSSLPDYITAKRAQRR